MCGIAGAFAFATAAVPVDRALLTQLNAAQQRRGPDGEGFWSSDDGRVALAHRRLAIIGLGPDGAQPMTDASGRWTVTFNGEIYNYRELRDELARDGLHMRTDTDTEVLIQVVAHWGEAGLRKLRGMFAFVLWDDLRKELWLARDPCGIKPLYVAEREGALWFASQARALAKCAPVDTARDPAALVGFYLWGHVPEPYSWWRGIRMFPAGHVQIVRPGESLRPPHAYVCIQDAYLAQPPRSLAAGELRQLILDTVRHHLVADVPVGMFLSGGIDSIVLAACAAELGVQLKTVTVAFDEFKDTPDDEAPQAERAAAALGTDHATVRIGRGEFEAIVDDFLEAMDQPTIDGLNTYLVSRAAAGQGLKVALSGLGGDELFGGYPSFRQIPLLLRCARVAALFPAIRNGLESLLWAMPRRLVPPKVAGLFGHGSNISISYFLRRALYLGNELDALLDEAWLAEGLAAVTDGRLASEVLRDFPAGVPLHAQISALESCLYMRNQLLRDTDWASMAFGLEVRTPYVDAALIGRLAPAIASTAPPRKGDLAQCSTRYSIPGRMKTGFVTPVRQWAIEKAGAPERGLRGWANNIHRQFRTFEARQRLVA